MQIVSEFDLDWLMANGYPCDCQSSPVISDYHDHVITGNHNILSIEALRKVIQMAQRFREQHKNTQKTKRLYWKLLKTMLNKRLEKKKS